MHPDLVSFRRSRWFTGIAAAVCLAVAPLPLLDNPAPKKWGTIVGHITDEAGAPIPSAQVRIDGTALGAVADGRGEYRIVRVPKGSYDLTATFVGFKLVRIVGLQVRAGRTVTQDITLAAQAVDIGDIEVVAAVNASRDAVVTKQRIDALEAASVTTGQSSAEFGYAQAGAVGIGADPGVPNTEEYHPIDDNRFLAANSNPLSTFSIDVDAAAYSNSRRFLMEGRAPLPDAVRIEEFINYFEYPYPDPTGTHPFSVTLEEGACPWAPEHRLVLIGLQSKRLAFDSVPPNNLVFLIDVSGSMDEPNKLPLVQRAFQMLVAQLRPQDRVAIVVYAGAAGLVLPSTKGSDRKAISEAIDRLEAGGSTAGGAGITLAYKVAAENFLPHGNNRVILATDGDFNVGASSEAELVRMIEQYREQGTYLTVLGFGTGNYKDARMEQLADKGNGNFAYVDGELEARKVFVNQLGATLVTVAKDVKLQVEFNPARVAEYRLIGYENRVLAKEDFNNDRKDAGELGAGHSVTALYEIVPTGAPLVAIPEDTLRYQFVSTTNQARFSREWLTLKLRYKRPTETQSRLMQETLVARDDLGPASPTFAFASAVAEFGMLLRDSEFKGRSSSASVLQRATAARGDDRDGYRAEFIDLVKRWEEIVKSTEKKKD